MIDYTKEAANWLSRVEASVALETLKVKPFVKKFFERLIQAPGEKWRKSAFIHTAVVKQLTHDQESFRGTCQKQT